MPSFTECENCGKRIRKNNINAHGNKPTGLCYGCYVKSLAAKPLSIRTKYNRSDNVPCIDCGKPCSKTNKYKRCVKCAAKYITDNKLFVVPGRKKIWHCTVCDKLLRQKRKTGMCQSCSNRVTSKTHTGANSSSWKGGITPLKLLVRTSVKYDTWRFAVFTRDSFTCCVCHAVGKLLEAHHIKLFSKIWEENNIKTYDEAIECQELWEVNNGITLCIECHDKAEHHWSKI